MQQNPVVVDVVTQPPVTPEISYGGMLLSALGVVGVILLAGLVVGIIVGGVIVWRRKRTVESDSHDHMTLRA